MSGNSKQRAVETGPSDEQRGVFRSEDGNLLQHYWVRPDGSLYHLSEDEIPLAFSKSRGHVVRARPIRPIATSVEDLEIVDDSESQGGVPVPTSPKHASDPSNPSSSDQYFYSGASEDFEYLPVEQQRAITKAKARLEAKARLSKSGQVGSSPAYAEASASLPSSRAADRGAAGRASSGSPGAPAPTVVELLCASVKRGQLVAAGEEAIKKMAEDIKNCAEFADLRARVDTLAKKQVEMEATMAHLIGLASGMSLPVPPHTGSSQPQTPVAGEMGPLHPGFTFPGATKAQMADPAPTAAMRRETSMPAFPSSNKAGKMPAVTPNPADDVFSNQVVSVAPIGQDGKAHWDQKTTAELFNEIFTKVEAFVRSFCTLSVYAAHQQPAVKRLIGLASMHMKDKRRAIELLEDQQNKHLLFTGLISHVITKEIFDSNWFVPFTSPWTEYYNNWWNQAEYATKSSTTANATDKRLQVHTTLAMLTQSIIKIPGFWTFKDLKVADFASNIMADFKILIPQHREPTAFVELKHVVDQALRLSVRLRTEPYFFTYEYPPLGSAWDHRYNVQRNPELTGQLCDEQPPLYVIRACVSPNIAQKSFENESGKGVKKDDVRKAEVLLCDRSKNLRRGGRRGGDFGNSRFARG